MGAMINPATFAGQVYPSAGVERRGVGSGREEGEEEEEPCPMATATADAG